MFDKLTKSRQSYTGPYASDDFCSVYVDGSEIARFNSTGLTMVTGSFVGVGSGGGSVTIEANTAGVGAPNVLEASEVGKYLTNFGSTAKNYHTLPTAAAGLIFTFICVDGDGLRATAASGDAIRFDLAVTSAAGYIESTSIGSTITLVAIDSDTWVVVSYVGDWTVSS